MNKLINLIPNSNFEKLSYNENSNRPNTMSITNWTISNENQINDKYAYNGSYSLALKSNNDIGGGAIICNIGTYNPQHTYYFRGYFKLVESNANNENVTIFIMKDMLSIVKSFNFNILKSNDLSWNSMSYYVTPLSTTASTYNNSCIWLKQSTQNGETRVLVDSLMLFDLTESFGKGYEPSQEWCDENIPYFEEEYDLKQIQKQIEFTCKDSFVYDEKTKKYYTNNLSPKITFVVRNVDKNYNLNNTSDILNKIYFTSRASNSKDDVSEPTSTIPINHSNAIVEFKNNNAYFTFTGFGFNNKRHHTIFTIYSDMSGGYRVSDSMTVYFTHNYNEFEYNLDYNLSYASTYLRKLKGTTNAYNDVPTNIDVYINGVKTSPVDILNQDDNLTVFEKDLYLSDGKNVIKVVATDICGNTKEKITEIYVNCMTPTPEKEELLKNFIADDDLKISLHLGNSDLEYKTNSAGLNKEINIDTSVNSHYFKLSGENAKLYRISKDNIPKIQGDIIKRPLAITFDYVEKIYDGTNDITPEIRKLKLDDGYYFCDVHKEYNDYLSSGFVRGTMERKITSETIFKQYDDIVDDYVINKPNIDYSTFYINIDGHEGYSLVNEDLNSAEIIFNNDSLSTIFKKITLIRNDENTILQFIYNQNNELPYKVSSEVNIKYNYSNNSNLEYVTYKTSDKGLVQIDFSKAFFKSKDVTDEVQRITLNDIKFIGDILGDASNNYQIANYNSTGKILRRTINPHIECLDKIYDGSPIVPFKMSDEFYNGLENSIPGDDVYIDNTYEGNKDDEFHTFTKSGSSILVFEDSNVGVNKLVSINSLFLEGYDAKNYKIGEITSNYKASILRRPINVVINKIRLIRATRKWEIDYTFLNDIKEDKLVISYNTSDNLNILVYGGIDNNGNSIHNDYSGKLDILSMYFNYPFNNEYQFKDVDTEVKTITDDSNTAYWINEVRDAEPDTERIDIITESNNSYPGKVKLTLDTLPDGAQTSYFESQNKDYKLYSGCKVMVTNINLSPLNDKSKNYTLLNSTCETEIEII